MTDSIPTSARVVIIGGGVAGASAAYHLAKLGWKDVVLLERQKIGGGTTWHAAGMVSRYRVSSSAMKVNQASAELYAKLKDETGVDPQWRAVGALMMARNEDRMHQIRRTTAMAEFLGVHCELVSAKGVGEHWPLIRCDDLVGGVWIPGDGCVHPANTARAMARGAELHGATVIEGVGVTELLQSNGRIVGVKTTHGEIRCQQVVLACGMWSRQLGLAAGVNLPLYPVEHHYVVSNTIEGASGDDPTCRDMDGYIYFRGETLPDGSGGIVLGAFQRYTKPWLVERVPDDFSFKLLEDDWDKFADPLREGEWRVPALKKFGYSRFVNGPESFTPDNNWLMGPTPEIDGLFALCGFNSGGIAAAGGAGKYLAEWMEAGEMTMDLVSVDVRRFGPWANNRALLRERVTEALGLHYQMAWPNREYETARDIRCSPLQSRLKSAGACYGTKAGWERPSWFAPAGMKPVTEYSFGRQNWFAAQAAEHRAARENVAIFDQTAFAKLIARGRDVVKVLQRLCGANVDVPVGSTSYTGLFNSRGTFESDLTVARTAEHEYYIVTGTAQGFKDQHWIRSNVRPDECCELVDVSSMFAVISVMGPNARRLLEKVTDADLSNAAFPFGATQLISIGQVMARAIRITYVGELGWELHVSVDQAVRAFDALTEAGKSLGAVNAGYNAINSLRLEKGYRAYGAELTPDETPLEAGLAFRLDWEKPGGFLGREALLKQKADGVRKRCAIFVLNDPSITLWGGEVLYRNGVTVGSTTSASFGHTVGGAIALAYVKNGDEVCTMDYLKTGQYEIAVNAVRHAATLHTKCPVDPDRKKILA